ncbi:hypothetical protein [Paenarthrobacter sp. A20]|uniref:hypothetical protein n=1 Tax=Paenarthrobacter sp. A20 TaxID=2817891 RepID=UPI00209CED06|nr:hypothetical protein [Paenarthrobacter sp. A20]MCP1415445.1 hypothetical protein [Paenarthrobacter sp. A20]
MSNQVEVTPGGVGFIRTTAKKAIPDAPLALKTARRRSWLVPRDLTAGRHSKVEPAQGTRKKA